MKLLSFAVPFALFAVLFFSPAPADAGLHVCNKTENKLFVSVATLWGDCDLTWCHEHVQGWWNIEPGDCKTPIGASLDTSGDTDYYYYAEDAQGGTWSGDLTLCVDGQSAFDYGDSDVDSCESNTHRRFKPIRTENYSDYTLSLTP
jgi:uncharacterized membrane protein